MTDTKDTATHDVEGLIERLSIRLRQSGLHKDVQLADDAASLIRQLRYERERQWCLRCGTVSGDGECHCNEFGEREPQFVNYADESAKNAREQHLRAIAAESELSRLRKRLEEVEVENARLTARLEEAERVIGMGRCACTASYEQAHAEWRQNDKAEDRHNKTVCDFYDAAQAFHEANHEGDR